MCTLEWLSSKFARIVLGDAASAPRQVLDADACLAHPPRTLEARAPEGHVDMAVRRRAPHLAVLDSGRRALSRENTEWREMAATSSFDKDLEPQEADFLNARLRKRVNN